MARSVAALLVIMIAAIALPSEAANPIFAFNNEAQAAVRENGIPSQIASRIYALLHVAQYKSIDKKATAQLQAAQAAYAGHTVLNLLFPWRWAKHDKAIKEYVAGIDAKKLAAAEDRGRKAGIDIVTKGATDGFDRYVPFAPAPAGSPAGQYQFAPNQTNSVYPQIAITLPLVVSKVSAFKVTPPLTIGSKEYTSNLAEVFSLGSKTSTNRTQYQTDTAFFWADGNTTSSVAGHFNWIAQTVLPNTTTIRATALLFARLNAAIWDASIVAYTAKYKFLFWRPITAIRQGDGSPANAAYVSASWAPLLNTPAHPEHPSGHSATVGAAGRVLANFFKTDKITFTIGTEYPGLAPRTYKSFSEAVDDVNLSRVYGGVHFRHAVLTGADVGRQVADAVYYKFV